MENNSPLLYHKIFGTKGDWMVIIHGLFGSSDNWQTLAKKWGEDIRVLVVDVRNHGKSFHSLDMTFSSMCEDILILLNYYQIGKTYLLGHSMGGKIAMNFGSLFPERLLGLIIADVAPYKYPPHHGEVFEILDQLDLEKFSSRREIEEAVLASMPNDIATAQFILKNIKRDDTTLKFKFKFNLEVLKKYYLYIIQEIPSIGFDGKVVFLQGQNSQYITPATSKLIFELYPNAEIEMIKNAGHWLHADNPNDVYELVRKIILEN